MSNQTSETASRGDRLSPERLEELKKLLPYTNGGTVITSNRLQAALPELIAEVEFLTKVAEQAVAGSDLRVGCGAWEGQARDFYEVTYPEAETVYSGHRSETYPTHAPELAQYLKRGKE